MLTDQGRAQLEAELAELALERAQLLELAARPDGRDAGDQAERALREFDIDQVDVRMRRARARLTAAERPRAIVRDDGTVQPGVVVWLDFGDGEPERLVVGGLAEVDEDVEVVTPSSPLGRALLGSPAGAEVRYRTPSGHRTVRVAAVDVVQEPSLAS
ncbi:MAG: GreA/GreB family elongation factor [Mycobacteriales bacterium]